MTDNGQDDPQKQFSQFLQELRVALPGVQVLLAFLLTVPFNTRFEKLGPAETAVFAVAVVAAAVATILLIAPTAQHRLVWRNGPPDYERLLRIGNREAIAGLAAVAVSMVASMFVVADLIYAAPLAGLVAGLVGVMIVWLWLVIPLRLRSRG